ncbi:uroporphyrinogen decarboxylase family protein [Haloimpatiens sp. FM7330]|uniref:uroporphyrinogen decarboxylase family protein n=1 Tax=Haloimpatiens sp. FM7330 TaxID=3298610 RepID=UPI0036429BB9
MEFKCVSDEFEKIPYEVVESTGLKFPEAHTKTQYITTLSRALKEYKKDAICRVPFCNTVEAEAFGGNIKLGDYKVGPRVSQYLIKSIDDFKNIKEIDFTKGRIGEVLKSIEKLRQAGEIVCLNVEGSFTIVSSLMEPRVFYKALRKNKDEAEKLLKVVEDSIVKYILEGIKRGANIISYGDPVGTIDIVGPKVYKEVSGKITYNILKRIEDKLECSIVHLCGKISTSLENIDLLQVEPIKYDDSLTYGEALVTLINKNNNNVKFIGHWCIKRSPVKKKENVIWNVKLKKEH